MFVMAALSVLTPVSPIGKFNMKRAVRFLTPTISLALAAAIWLPLLHLFFRPALSDFRQQHAVAPQARQLAARHLALWEDPGRREQEMARMRASNAEWDFMGRTYFVLALANMAIAIRRRKAATWA